MKKVKTELCCASPEAIELAKKYHFNRIELCQNLEIGGTTPSAALIQLAVQSGVETHVLIRPRSGNFVYSFGEKEMMIADIKTCASSGVKGVVVGALTLEKTVDLETISKMLETAPKLDFTFHRAFDDIIHWKSEMDLLIQLGFKRILTSGGQPTTLEGKDRLEEMVQFANGRIEIMIGGGISAENVSELIIKIQPDAVHFSGTSLEKSSNDSLFDVDRLIVDQEKIESILLKLKPFS